MRSLRFILFLGSLLFTSISLFAQYPQLSLKDIHNNTFSFQSLKDKKKPVVLSFFATWCKPCLLELNNFNEILPEWHTEKDFQFIAISIDQGIDSQKVKPLAEGNGWEFPILLDSNGELKRNLQIEFVPTLILFDVKGEIVYKHTGYNEGQEEQLWKILQKL